jgi:hypothetical protein
MQRENSGIVVAGKTQIPDPPDEKKNKSMET